MQGNSKLKAYFHSQLGKGVLIFLVGIPLLAAAGLGLIVMAIGGYMIYSSMGAASDAEVDTQMRRAVEWAKKRAHEKTNIDDDAAEIAAPTEVLTGIYTNSVLLDQRRRPIKVGVRKGRDGRPRFNPVHVTVLIFGKDQIATYQTAIDLIGGGTYAEAMEEYFYNDVIGIKNDTSTWKDKDAKGNDIVKTTQRVSLVTSSGDRISVTIGVDNDAADWNSYASGIEPQINNIKKLLRERKAARAAG